MLKFIKQYAESIAGVNIYPIVSLLIFFLFFVAVLYYVKKMNKTEVNDLRNLPLEDGIREETDQLQNLKHA